jgi:hypothetical protein
MGKFKEMDLLRQEREAFDADYPMEPTPRDDMWVAWNSEDGFTFWDNEQQATLWSSIVSNEWPVQYVMQKVNIQTQIVKDNLQSAPVQEPVAHCEAGPEYCQQCYLEDRSLALAAAVRYVQNNTPQLVSDEICMALTTPPAAQPAEECAAILYRDHNENPWVHVIQKDLPSGTKLVAITKGQP